MKTEKKLFSFRFSICLGVKVGENEYLKKVAKTKKSSDFIAFPSSVSCLWVDERKLHIKPNNLEHQLYERVVDIFPS